MIKSGLYVGNKEKIIIVLSFFILLTGLAYAQSMDTKSNIKKYLILSRNDFEIDSKSKNADERKAYADLKAADLDGGKPDGVITYSEYLIYLSKSGPNAVSAYDFALSKVLPALSDFSFVEKDGVLAVGMLTQTLEISKGLVLPVGAKVSLMSWGILRINLPNDMVLKNISVRGGKETPIDLYFGGSYGFFLGQFQLAEDTIINGVPCKATTVDVWDINIELMANGSVRRATLFNIYTDVTSGIDFVPGEKILLGWNGDLESAVITQDRIIQGKSLVAYGATQVNKGFWSGDLPNIYFEKGLAKITYEDNRPLAGNSIYGKNQYYYGTDGTTVVGISAPDSYFLGFPVMLTQTKQPWDWSQPEPSVVVSEGKAQFTLDVGAQILGKPGIVSLPAGAKLTVDIKTECCLSVIYPDGKTVSYDAVSDKMSPIKVPVEQQSAQILAWMERWLKDNPEKADGNGRDIRQSHIILRDKMLAIEKSLEKTRFYLKFLEDFALYKNKAFGLVAGNIALDFNGDGKIQSEEIVPEILLDGATNQFSLEKLVGLLVEKAAVLPLAKLKALGTIMSTLPIAGATDDLGIFDKLGAALSQAGMHPFAAKKIYYFPNGSGDKIKIDTIEFYPSGRPKSLRVDVENQGNLPIYVSLPGVEKKVEAWLYKSEKAKESTAHKDDPKYWLGKGLDPEYWTRINTFTFHDSGALHSFRGIPWIPFPLQLPSEITWRPSDENPPTPNVVEWNPFGQIAGMSEPNGFFDLPGGITVKSPRWIRFWENVPYGRIYVQCNPARKAGITIKEGTYTFYKLVDNKWVPYPRTFAEDTSLTVNGFMMDIKGNITNYW